MPLIDSFQRPIQYLRLSVTDRCDLRCSYCLPEDHQQFGEPEHWLSFAEINRVVAAFAELGVRHVRITGGEPLVRRNLPDLINQLSQHGLEDLSLSTNAVQMKRYAVPLKAAGIQRINVSLDSLQADRFQQITKGKLSKVMNGLMAAKSAGFAPIKINMVIMAGINDDEAADMLRFCIEHGFILRFIETMPMGHTGQDVSKNQYLSLEVIKQALQAEFDLVPEIMPGSGPASGRMRDIDLTSSQGPARYLRVSGTETTVGFITPISQHFCETCNRVRLSADGTLYMCLGQEHSVNLRMPLRNGASDDDLKVLIQRAINLKPERHEFKDNPDKPLRFMSVTGG